MSNEELQNQIDDIKAQLKQLGDVYGIPLENTNALEAAGFVRVPFGATSVVRSNGKSSSLQANKAGTVTYYVANSSGGTVTTAVTFTNGILQ